MKTWTTLAAVVVVAMTTLSGCVIAPAGPDRQHSYDRQYQDREHHDRRHNDGRWNDGDHAGGTGTPD